MATSSGECSAAMSPHQTADQDSENMAVKDEQSQDASQFIPADSEGTRDGHLIEKKAAAAKSKDPSRPKRKKAKRACYACQRGHLTCGDERPCQRCIKRGFQDACHDGVRKKAKYLHDAPNEVLMAGSGANLYSQRNASQGNISGANNLSNVPPQQITSPSYYTAQQSPNYSSYPQSKTELQDSTVGPENFTSQSPGTPTFQMAQALPNQGLSPSLPQSAEETPSAANPAPSQFNTAFFDPSDPALFNFDLASMNFGNHYGALEFGMLGHMATGVGDTPPSDNGTHRGSIGQNNSGTFGLAGSNFSESPSTQGPYLFGDSTLNDWTPTAPISRRNVFGPNANVMGGNLSDKPHAFAIESAPANFASPASNESPMMTSSAATFDDTANAAPFNSRQLPQQQPQQQQRPQPIVSTPQLKQQNLYLGSKRRHKNASSIYDSVKDPYSYTSGFHSLTAFIQRRLSPQKTLRIAKALASIRPSFIATTKTLNRDDLIFMEKCFQRTLWEYEDFISACGTPTIVCRRTGEIAAVGKEFSILTGWKKEVLLGKEPNRNVNTGGSSGLLTGSTSRGSYTPRPSTAELYNPSAAPRTQPVFLAELLDDESVIEFYEDFAKLAFGDSRGSVMTTCKLLKYKTKVDNDMIASGNCEGQQNGDIAGNGEINDLNGNSNGTAGNGQSRGQQRRWGKGEIAGEAGMNQLGFRDGKVECSYCWTVKRDVFDIPMLIVMNFLPCI